MDIKVTPSTQLSTEWPLELSSPTGSYWAKLLHPIPADTGKSQDGGNGAEPQHSALPK